MLTLEELRESGGWTKKKLNQLGYDVIGAAIEVHRQLGPGLLESVYEECLAEELSYRSFDVQRQVRFPLVYREKELKTPLIIDMIVDEMIVVELKAVKKVLPVHEAQLLSYMNLSKLPKGVLINFHTMNIVASAKHMVNAYWDDYY